jgi:DNA-binding response OmpR family regulator
MIAAPGPDWPLVAVLDDDVRFIRMVERVLYDEEIAVAPVTTLGLDDALHVIETLRPAVALVDIFMYGSASGFDVIERLRDHAPTASLPLVVTSGARREIGRRVAYLQSHRCDVLLKPFAPADLTAAVRRALSPARLTLMPAARATQTRAAARNANAV